MNARFSMIVPILSCAWLASCAAEQRPDADGGSKPGPSIVNAPIDPAGNAPEDLWVEIAVAPGRGIEGRARVEERPARFVLLPGGELFGATDALPPRGQRPARVRRLTREQVNGLWSTLSAAGFTNRSLSDGAGNAALLVPEAGEIMTTIEIHAADDRFVFVRRYRPGEQQERSVRGVVRAFALAAWASDEGLAESAEMPTRYEVGVDPYARFAPRADLPKAEQKP